jgi:hypothetical protein
LTVEVIEEDHHGDAVLPSPSKIGHPFPNTKTLRIRDEETFEKRLSWRD